MRAMTAIHFGLLSCALAAVIAGPAQLAAEKGPNEALTPYARIPIAPLGYLAPSSFYLQERFSSATLDFVDRDHLLFTFHRNGLMRRMPENAEDDTGQMIRAVVLKIGTGEVEKTADWRMQDRSQYLWPLGDGEFLLRQGKQLFLMDRTLNLRPYLEVSAPVRQLQLSPDRKVLLIQVAAPRPKDPPPDSEMLGTGSRAVKIYIVRLEDRKIIAESESRAAVDLPLYETGFIETLDAQRNEWMVRFKPFHGQDRTLATVQSACRPRTKALAPDTALITTCGTNGEDHNVMAVSLDGKVLWRQRWSSRYIWPTFETSEDGSRFAYGSLDVAHSVGVLDPVDMSDFRNQTVGIFDTANGLLHFVRDADPILTSGQNYALSKDGRSFAILRDGAIEVYAVPDEPMLTAQKR